jgi:hypothetical protein
MLVLSITILAAVLVTATVVSIASAATSITVQTKTNRHPVTSTGSHIISSAHTHGINVQNMKNYHPVKVAVCSAGVQPEYRTVCSHAVSSAPHGEYGQCYTVSIIDGDHAVPSPSPQSYDCPAPFSGVWIKPGPAPSFSFGGRLDGCVGLVYPDTISSRRECADISSEGGLKPLDNAAIEIKAYIGNDKHYWYTPGVVTKTKADGTFDGKLSLPIPCDSPVYHDHTAYTTFYLNIPPADNHYVKGSKIPGPYNEPVSFGQVTFPMNVCKAPEVALVKDITINADMSVVPTKFIYSGKVVDLGGTPVKGVKVGLILPNYLDNNPLTGHFHVFTMTECAGGQPTCLVETKADGTFSGYFVSCDSSTTLKHDANFQAMLIYGQPYYSAPSQPPWQFSTKPCSGLAPTHEKQNLLSDR